MKKPPSPGEGGFCHNTPSQYFLSSPHMEVLKRTT